MYLVLHINEIKRYWKILKADPYNNRPDIETVNEYINEVKAGRVTAGGVKIILNEKLPEIKKEALKMK